MQVLVSGVVGGGQVDVTSGSNTCKSPKQFLLHRPRGAYTVFTSHPIATACHSPPSLASCSIQHLSLHTERLVHSFLSIPPPPSLPSSSSSSSLSNISKAPETCEKSCLTKEDIRKAIIQFLTYCEAEFRNFIESHESFVIKGVVLVYRNAVQQIRMDALLEPLNVMDMCKIYPYSVTLGPRGFVRSHPECKDTQWLIDRRPLEELLSQSIQEVLLVDSVGCIYEGLTTNVFFILRDQGQVVIHTAPTHSHVLHGTGIDRVKQACFKLQILFEMKFPVLGPHSSSLWFGAFLTNATKPFIPVHQIILAPECHGEPGKIVLSIDNHIMKSFENELLPKPRLL